ncbi:MAG: N-acetyl-gamma-glutamyl-phosphate reductase [Ardenticatenaceae bacterium]|nr:N-acetyl-gamma-glutamyl-phosphate reductase [Anaerolineales bacterium]MCB8921763.1 N-acetyl-gamma-glutamyl-phosphate reductase [Ardenticatenaceae bacterium]MCB8990718.1 N-acetyl-gamma-glutamyl-phosphate reductase [Ardenticatenaceae bacterium]
MIKAGIFGATGYTGWELVKILQRHPQAEIGFVTSTSQAERPLSTIYPTAPDLILVAPQDAPLNEVDVAFLCLPHGAAAETAVTCLNAGLTVIDLSADFRLRDVAAYEQWYKTIHPAPELLETAVYGLTEFARSQLPGAKLIANPGCYPTSILLAAQPLLAADAIAGTLIVDSKSGVSGAGRSPKQNTHFVEVADNFSPYNIGQVHRHWPEIVQGLGFWHASPPDLVFSPHLLPVPRGILSTIYAPLKPGWQLSELHQLFSETYADEPFVQVLPLGSLATLAHVNYTNRCAIGLAQAGDTLIVTSAIDNLIKGAAGQAVQNMNVALGLKETAGLE